MPGVRVDGNDVIALMHVLGRGDAARARTGGGPTLIEAVTYRIQPHTNADDAARYRDPAEVELWLARDPVDRLARYLTAIGQLDESRGRRDRRRVRAVRHRDARAADRGTGGRFGRDVRARLRRADPATARRSEPWSRRDRGERTKSGTSDG